MVEHYHLFGKGIFLNTRVVDGQNLEVVISIESYDPVRDQCERLRNEVFVKELAYYPRTDQSRETDKYDKLALHVVTRDKLNIVGYCRLLPLENAQFMQSYKTLGINPHAIRAVEVTRFCLTKKWRKTRQFICLGVGVYLGALLLNRDTILASAPDDFKSMYLALGGNILGSVNLSKRHGDRQIFCIERDRFKGVIGAEKMIPELKSKGCCSLECRTKQLLSDLSTTSVRPLGNLAQ